MDTNVKSEDLRRSSVKVKLRLAFSIIGVFVGFSAGLTFSVHFKNYNAGLWGICSGIAALVALCVTVAFIKGHWNSNPQRFRGFMLSGCFIQLAGICGFVAYLVLAISNKQGVVAYGNGFYIACVWCFMTWKWGFLLLIYSRSYYRTYNTNHGFLNAETKGQRPYTTLQEDS